MKLVDWSIGAGSLSAFEQEMGTARKVGAPTHLGYNLQMLADYGVQLSDKQDTAPGEGSGLVISVNIVPQGAVMRICTVLPCGYTHWADVVYPWMSLMTMPQPTLRTYVKDALKKLDEHNNAHYLEHTGNVCPLHTDEDEHAE